MGLLEGVTYYYLTSAQYQAVSEFANAPDAESILAEAGMTITVGEINNLLKDYELVNGNYYAGFDKIDTLELDFLTTLLDTEIETYFVATSAGKAGIGA